MRVSWRPRRSLSLGLGVLVLVLAGCQSSGAESRPPPLAFTWVPTAAPSATAEQAFAASFRPLQMCASGPAAAVTTTWVVTGPTYAMAVLVADCHTDPNNTWQGVVFVQLDIDTPYQPRCPHWQLVGGTMMVSRHPSPAPPAAVVGQVPAWLPLPPDGYQSDPLGGDIVTPSAVQVWFSGARDFVAGRFRGPALRPANAQALSRGPEGWLTEEHGLVSVVLPQPGGWTFFFAGTAPPAQVEDVARRALPHVDELLPWPSSLPADAPTPTPAC